MKGIIALDIVFLIVLSLFGCTVNCGAQNRIFSYEECGSIACTHSNQIYMNNIIPLYLSTSKESHQKRLCILMHEIFHCLTRNDEEFRRKMYSINNFDVNDKELDIPNCMVNMLISNPNVDHYNAYSTFTINFSHAFIYGLGGYMKYSNPEIIQKLSS